MPLGQVFAGHLVLETAATTQHLVQLCCPVILQLLALIDDNAVHLHPHAIQQDAAPLPSPDVDPARVSEVMDLLTSMAGHAQVQQLLMSVTGHHALVSALALPVCASNCCWHYRSPSGMAQGWLGGSGRPLSCSSRCGVHLRPPRRVLCRQLKQPARLWRIACSSVWCLLASWSQPATCSAWTSHHGWCDECSHSTGLQQAPRSAAPACVCVPNPVGHCSAAAEAMQSTSRMPLKAAATAARWYPAAAVL